MAMLNSSALERAREESGGNLQRFIELVPARQKATLEYQNMIRELEGLQYQKEEREENARLRAEEQRKLAEERLKQYKKNYLLGKASKIERDIISAPKEADNQWYEKARGEISELKGTDDKDVLSQYDLLTKLASQKRVGQDLDSIYKDLASKQQPMITQSKASGYEGALRPEIEQKLIDESRAKNLFEPDEALSTTNLKLTLSQKEQEGERKARIALATAKMKVDPTIYKNADVNTQASIDKLVKVTNAMAKPYEDRIVILLKKEYRTDQDNELLDKYTNELNQIKTKYDDQYNAIMNTSSGMSSRKIVSQEPELSSVKKPQITTGQQQPKKTINELFPDVDFTGAQKAEVKTKAGETVKIFVKNGKPVKDKNGNVIIIK